MAITPNINIIFIFFTVIYQIYIFHTFTLVFMIVDKKRNHNTEKNNVSLKINFTSIFLKFQKLLCIA